MDLRRATLCMQAPIAKLFYARLGGAIVPLDFTVVTVRRKQPYLDWVRGLSEPAGDVSLENFNQDPTAYVVPPVEFEGDAEGILSTHFGAIFEAELASFWLIRSDWPGARTFAMFKEWFDCTVCSLAVDVTAGRRAGPTVVRPIRRPAPLRSQSFLPARVRAAG